MLTTNTFTNQGRSPSISLRPAAAPPGASFRKRSRSGSSPPLPAKRARKFLPTRISDSSQQTPGLTSPLPTKRARSGSPSPFPSKKARDDLYSTIGLDDVYPEFEEDTPAGSDSLDGSIYEDCSEGELSELESSNDVVSNCLTLFFQNPILPWYP